MAGVSNETAYQAQWYAVATRPRQESVARQHLHRQNYKVLLPEMRLRKRRQNKWVWLVEPLFPGYVFVQLAFGDVDTAPIRSTRGCRGLVRFGEHCPPLPPALVDELISRTGGAEESCPLFASGDNIIVAAGPFSGLPAVFDMPRGSDRAQVLIGILGRVQPVILDIDSLAPP